MDSRIEKIQGKKDVLYVPYDPVRRNWDAMILKALDANGIKDRLSVLVIAEPVELKNRNQRS